MGIAKNACFPRRESIPHSISLLNRVFDNLTVLQNVLLGQSHYREGILDPFLKKCSQDLISQSLELLRFVGLEAKKNDLASDLSYGQQKLLDLAIALVKKPKLLLLDEPTAGVNLTHHLVGFHKGASAICNIATAFAPSPLEKPGRRT